MTAVAAVAAPVWGDGEPDLFAATGADVLGSDDALTFASLPGLPDPSAQPWSALALVPACRGSARCSSPAPVRPGSSAC